MFGIEKVDLKRSRSDSNDSLSSIESATTPDARKRRRCWRKEEDELLVSAMEYLGSKDPFSWKDIACAVPGRNSKQCRDRWNTLRLEGNNKREWTKEEDKLLLELQKEHGNRWVRISDHFTNCNDNAVKSHYRYLMKKRGEQESINAEQTMAKADPNVNTRLGGRRDSNQEVIEWCGYLAFHVLTEEKTRGSEQQAFQVVAQRQCQRILDFCDNDLDLLFDN